MQMRRGPARQRGRRRWEGPSTLMGAGSRDGSGPGRVVPATLTRSRIAVLATLPVLLTVLDTPWDMATLIVAVLWAMAQDWPPAVMAVCLVVSVTAAAVLSGLGL